MNNQNAGHYIYIYILVKYPPSAGFSSPSGGVALPVLIWETAAEGGGERKNGKKIGAPWAPPIWGAGGAPVGPSAYAAFGAFWAPAAPQMVLKT